MTANKKKLLGQFFSGNKIAEMIEALVPSQSVTSVIDPMCGIGDLLLPYSAIENVTGIEIDKQLYGTIVNRMPNINCICANAFSAQTLSSLDYNGYDLVVANPPYVRKELIGKAENSRFSLTDITCNLHYFTDEFHTLSEKEKEKMHQAIDKVSGLSDLSIPSWLLCVMLVNRNGKFAIVLPNSWLSREYAQPVLEILDYLFDVNYILNDINGVWFRGDALVRTSIVIASRKTSHKKRASIVDLYESAQNAKSLYGNVAEKQNFADFINKGESVPNVCEIRSLSNNTISSIRSDRIEDSIRSVSLGADNYSSMPTLESIGLKISQGLRTGANGFFYLKMTDKNRYVSEISSVSIPYTDKFFVPVIQGQSDLSDKYVVNTRLNTALLNIQDSIVQEDYDKTKEEYRIGYNILPQEIQDYILEASKLKIKGKEIPTLSSVRTNVSQPKNGLYRFWYMIPKLRNRHKAKIFIPRVNSNSVIAYKSEVNNAVVDANFSTIDNNNVEHWSNNALVAVLNTTWCQFQYEQIGTVMGGGALKLEAVQLRRIKVPNLSHENLLKLDEIGRNLCNSKISSSSLLIDEADMCLLSSFLHDKEQAKRFLAEIKLKLQHCKEARQ